MVIKPILFGCEGIVLSASERAFFASAQPLGFILFKRNIETPEQLRQLTSDLRAAVGRTDAPIFIDQEGGPVARLKMPYWPDLPAMRTIGEVYERDMLLGAELARLHACLTADMLLDVGINGNFAPVLDLFIEGATSAIGRRAISRDPTVVASAAATLIDTYLDQGVFPVIKHMPGHGRALVDPHLTLPVVDASYEELLAEDFEPFRRLYHAPFGMNCHVVFTALDPSKPVSLSRKVFDEIIRGVIGFKGVVFSDDLAMKALDGPVDKIATEALAAGADILLYCPGLMPEMQQISAVLPPISDETEKRWKRAVSMVNRTPSPINRDTDFARFQQLLAEI